MSRTFIDANGNKIKFTNIEALNEISKSVYVDDEVVNQCFRQVKSALERKEKLEKFCELLKCLIYNKRFIYIQGIIDSKSYIEYKSLEFNLFGKNDINKTEFNLLKEMLEEKQ